MPPKAAAPSADGLTLSGRQVEMLGKLLCSLDVKINGTDFGRLIGLNSPNNGGAALKSLVALFGVAVKDGGFYEMNGDAAAAAATAPRASGTGTAAKSGGAGKRKRGDKKEDGSSTKKAKKSAAVSATEDVEEPADATDAADAADGTETSD